MSALIKQTVNSVVFMNGMSSAEDVRCLILEIDCEGAGRFFTLKTEKTGSEIYFSTPDDFKLLYETAAAMWAQGDIYAPGDTDNDLVGVKKPELSRMFKDLDSSRAEIEVLTRQRDFLLREMLRIEDDPGNCIHIAAEARNIVCADEFYRDNYSA